MSQTISQIRTALATALTGLTGVTIYPIWPNDPATIDTPAILIKPTGARLDAFGEQVTHLFELAVLFNPRFPATQQTALDTLLSFSGATTASIFQRLWANANLSGEVERVELAPAWRDYGGHEIGVQEFIGAILDVEVWITIA